MQTTVTKSQVDYMVDKLYEAIGLYPDDIRIWLDCYKLAVDIQTTLDNMAVDDADIGKEAFDKYISNVHWMKDHWPLSHSEPEQPLMSNIKF